MYVITASLSPRITASVIRNSATTLHTNDAIEPSATSVSIFGERFMSALKPLMKNFWFITMTIPASRSWISPMATWLPSSHDGRGKPHIM